VARNDRRRSRQWHFSDSGSRFDARRRYQPTIDHDPISKTFTRKIFHCKRCKNRVVSNVSHCPFCGKNLLPVYRRFWFWLIIVVAAGVAAGALVFLSPPIEDGESRVEIPPPLVVGAPEGSPIKDLDMGTTVDCNSLLVTVMESLQGPIASDGKPITAVKVQFLNKNAADAMLYSTQWQLETAGGERIDCYIGRTEQGENIISDLDSQSLAPDASLTVTLYFAADAPARVVFAPNALSYSESGLVTWLLSGQGDTTDATGAESGTDATEGS
jgi:RNA polymerase subunit RPABC4/transcription elongation factor Spt4